jgi:hypothetical protein
MRMAMRAHRKKYGSHTQVYMRRISPYRFGTVDHLVKKNMPGKLFFVFAKIRVPLVCTYVYCTKWSRNTSLIHVKVHKRAHKHNSTMASDASPGTTNPKMDESFIHTAQTS